MARKLTVKQQKFADEYIICGNATEAAKKAGYAERSARSIGNENLSKPDIKSYIDERLEKLRKESIAEQDEILQALTAVLRGEKTGIALVGAGQGHQTVKEVEPTIQEKIKAAELLGKRHAMWTDRQEISGDMGVTIVDDVDDE